MSNNKPIYKILTLEGVPVPVFKNDRITKISGIPYDNLYITEIQPLVHSSIMIPTMFNIVEIEITPLKRGSDPRESAWDDDFGAVTTPSGIPSEVPTDTPYMIEGTQHSSRMARVQMGQIGDNKDSIGWITLEAYDDLGGHDAYRLHYGNRNKN